MCYLNSVYFNRRGAQRETTQRGAEVLKFIVYFVHNERTNCQEGFQREPVSMMQ
jgi:hypothetical protein